MVTESEEDEESTLDVDDSPTALLEVVVTEEVDFVETDTQADVDKLEDNELVVLLSTDEEETTLVKF